MRVVLRRVGTEREQEPATIHFRQRLSISWARGAAAWRATAADAQGVQAARNIDQAAWPRLERLDLLKQVFGFDYEGLERTVDVHVMNLRRKIERDPAQPEYIQTVYGWVQVC